MMNSQSMQTLVDPVCRNKMPLFDGTTASTGLSKPQTLPGFLGKQALQYHGAYFAYDPRGKDRAGFTQPWSKTAALDGPVSHLAGMEAQNHVVYRQDSNSSEEGHSHSSSLCRTQGKQGFTVYTKSPGASSPTAATPAAAGKQRAGGENPSPPSENPVYLAIPKPVYRHSPCCSELGCVMGQRYTIEHGSPRIPSTVYEHDWMQTNAHYAERPPVQIKAPDALLQQRGLQLEHGAEPVQRMAVGAYSPSRARTFPVLIDPNYSSYPCTPTRTLFSSLSEQSQCLQTPPGFPSFYPPHASYEHMTSEVYQDCSPMSKYGQLTQHPILYYPQANVEVENRPECKDISSMQRQHVPVILKHTMSNPREPFIVPQSLRGEIPLPTAETLPNHPFLRGFDYSCYAVPRFHLNASQIRRPLKRQHAAAGFHSNRANASPSTQRVGHSAASVASLHKEKASAGLQVDKAHSSSPFLHVGRTSPARCTSQSGISPQSVQVNRFFPPLTSLHLDRPVLPPAGVNMDRLIDFNRYEAQVTCPKLQTGLPVSAAAWLPRSPCSESFPSVVTNGASVRKTIYSPPSVTGDSSSVSSSGGAVVKGCLQRSLSPSSPPVKIKEDLCEVEPMRKRQKVATEIVRQGAKNDSPPMPVIDNVFSLAPYQAYLKASGALLSDRSLQRTVQLSEHGQVKAKPDVKENRADEDERQAGDVVIPPKGCSDSSPEEPVVELIEPDNIKVEKVEPSGAEGSEETLGEKDDTSITIKKESEESVASEGDLLVIKMCEPDDELEGKPPDAATASSSQADTSSLPVTALQPEPMNPLKHQVSFKNIPPQCLKLSTYKILLPDSKSSCPISPPEKPSLQPAADLKPKVEPLIPVRKHFLELHHSLCRLVSKSVSGSPEQELRSWFAQLKLPELTSSSTKVQKVSCLLGGGTREAWLTEETASALSKVLERLREYTFKEHCSFPHVMRAGAVFLPMFVVKELLFPTVQGSFIDQVLQEHRVELRPTTLSEEKILIQLHKHTCSSRLRRLMSLKHLPDIYGDVLNLFYYSCVCKRLGLDIDDPANGEQSSNNSWTSPADTMASPESPSESQPEETSHLNRDRTETRERSSFEYMFLDNGLSDEDCVSAGVLNTFRKDDCKSEETESKGRFHIAAEDPSLIPQNSWMCPLTLEEFSASDTEAEESSSLQSVGQSSGPVKSAARSQSCSGVILKLRRMFSEGLKRKKACYQAVPDTEAFPDASLTQTDGEVEITCDTDIRRASPKNTHKWQRTGNVSHALRPLSSSSNRKHSSLLKIKYCPYLSACHSAEHRRRWVLRSAVQRARRAMRFYYPDLVGKKIYHLYEEDDKSEVWYRGEVLRIHEAHSNPLKTVFEVKYDSEPEWKYYLELLIDYKKGWLKIED